MIVSLLEQAAPGAQRALLQTQLFVGAGHAGWRIANRIRFPIVQRHNFEVALMQCD